MTSDSPSSGARMDDPNQDLYCLECGYNLRGLAGDPRRCPECGYLNPMGDLELPAHLISQQLRRMETAPTVCLGAALFTVLFGGLLAAMVVVGGVREEQVFICCGTLLVPAWIAWISGAATFRSACRVQPGWRRALAWYHVYGLVVLAPAAGVIYSLGLLFADLPSARPNGNFAIVAVLLDLGCFAAGYVLARWARRRTTEMMYPLQRGTAISVARDQLRRRLRGERIL